MVATSETSQRVHLQCPLTETLIAICQEVYCCVIKRDTAHGTCTSCKSTLWTLNYPGCLFHTGTSWADSAASQQCPAHHRAAAATDAIPQLLQILA